MKYMYNYKEADKIVNSKTIMLKDMFETCVAETKEDFSVMPFLDLLLPFRFSLGPDGYYWAAQIAVALFNTISHDDDYDRWHTVSEIMKRKCRMIEIEPLYGEVILRRWEKFTSRKAELIKT